MVGKTLMVPSGQVAYNLVLAPPLTSLQPRVDYLTSTRLFVPIINTTYLAELLQGLSEIMRVKLLAYLVQGKYPIYVK